MVDLSLDSSKIYALSQTPTYKKCMCVFGKTPLAGEILKHSKNLIEKVRHSPERNFLRHLRSKIRKFENSI